VDAASFVSELLRRWREAPRPPGVQKAADVRTPSFASGPGNVFVSYARENLEAAERLRSQLETIGGADPWFDKRKLTPGDEWERTIPAAIKSCDIFLCCFPPKRKSGWKDIFGASGMRPTTEAAICRQPGNS
jgi:TIR domain